MLSYVALLGCVVTGELVKLCLSCVSCIELCCCELFCIDTMVLIQHYYCDYLALG